MLQAVRESALDELHGFFNGHFSGNRHQKMHMIRHDHEVMQ